MLKTIGPFLAVIGIDLIVTEISVKQHMRVVLVLVLCALVVTLWQAVSVVRENRLEKQTRPDPSQGWPPVSGPIPPMPEPPKKEEKP